MRIAWKGLSISVILLGFICAGCTSSSTAGLEKNKAIVRHCFEEVEKGNWAMFDELLTRDYVYHEPGRSFTRDESKQFMQSVRVAFSDRHFTIEEMIAEGDKVVTRYTSSATHTGEFMGIPATGKKVVVTGIIISRIAQGKIAEDWEQMDTLGFMVQLGAIPPIGEPGEK